MAENWEVAESLSSVTQFTVTDAPDEDWIYEDSERAYVTDEAAERFTRLHVETIVALQIALATGEFRPGRYRREATWSIDWQRDESGQ